MLYLPGTMRSVYDQSVDLLAERLARACAAVTGRPFLADRSATTLVLEPGTELRLRTITCADEPTRDIVLAEADYTPKLTASLEESGIVIQFFKLLHLLGRMAPTVVRLLWKSVPEPHSHLSRGQKSLVALAYILGFAAFVSIGVTAFEVVAALVGTVTETFKDGTPAADETQGFLSGYPLLGAALSIVLIVCSIGAAVVAVLWSLMPSRIPDSIVAVGKEYSGLVRYILYGERRQEIDGYASAVRDCLAERYPGSDLHLLCFSFGCVIGFNHLFPKPEWKQHNASAFRTVTFLGFPYVVIDAAFPAYLGGRESGPAAEGFPWKNVFLRNDVLGSRLHAHLGEIFAARGNARVEDVMVEPQKGTRLNFVADHMAYWDPDSDECSQAFMEVARSLLADRG